MISFSFNYNRHPSANDKFSKLLLTPETDMVLENSDPKNNQNTMIWDMTSLGTKNYNFRINNRNTEKINQEWQISDSQWNAICILHISQQGSNSIYRLNDQPEPNRYLGEIKVAVQVLYVKSDTENNSSRVTQQDVIKYMMKTHYKEIQQMKVQQNLLANKEKIKQLEETNKKLENKYIEEVE